MLRCTSIRRASRSRGDLGAERAARHGAAQACGQNARSEGLATSTTFLPPLRRMARNVASLDACFAVIFGHADRADGAMGAGAIVGKRLIGMPVYFHGRSGRPAMRQLDACDGRVCRSLKKATML